MYVGKRLFSPITTRDADSKLDIMFALDDDTNPFNDSDNSDYKKLVVSLAKRKEEPLAQKQNLNGYPTDADIGTHYVQIRATDANKRVRYDYLLQSRSGTKQ